MGSKKSVEMNLLGNMVRMVRRNLKICLALLHELSRLRRQLQYRTGISAVERDTWKAAHGEELNDELKNVLKQYKLPPYLLTFLEWLFLATEEEVARLKAYVKKPQGETPQGYYHLVGPAVQFNSPFRAGWLIDAEYRVAITTVEKPGYWQIWSTQPWSRDPSLGDPLTFSPVLLNQLLRDSGDFVVRGNLDLFDVHSWRELGKFLAWVKKGKGMGKQLGLVAGRQKGATVQRKKVLDGMSWDEVQILVAQQPQSYIQLQNKYVNSRTRQYKEEFKGIHPGQDPPKTELMRLRESAISNFARHVKKPAVPQAK